MSNSQRVGVGPLGVGLVGNGMAARVFHAPYIAACAGLDLRAVVSRRAEAELPLPGLARVPDIADLLGDPAIDLVVIATPGATHADLAARALDAGKHVVVDKPFALDLASAQDLVSRAKAMDRVVTAFHNRRGDADFLAIEAAIAAGEIGRVVHFESHFDRFRPAVRERWREDGSEGSGVWFDLGPHLVDQALCLFGAPEAVSADIAALREGGRSDDYAHVTLHYPQMRSILHAGMCVAGGEPRFRVHGTGGSLVKYGLDPQEAQSVAGMRPGDPDWGRDPEPLVRFDGDGVRHEMALPRGRQECFYNDVAAACLGEKAAAVSGKDILLVQAVIEAARMASRTGQRVALADVLEEAGPK